ncbi:PQQ-binding-like beta-propeller repeat protein [Verrucomicrobiota bacterium]
MIRGILAVLVLTTAPCAFGNPRADYQELVVRRDALVATLEKKTPPQVLSLRFDEGADHDDAWLTLRRADGTWRAAYAEVPGWHQGTMKDWRSYYHGNYTYGCWRPNLRFPADAAALALDGRRLTGMLNVAFRLDRTFVQRQPPGEYVQWWDKFISGGHSLPREMRYTIDADVRPESCLLDMVLEGGVYWDSTFVPSRKGKAQRSVTRRPISVRLQVPSTRFTLAEVKTTSWTPGFHEAAPEGLAFADGKLTGTLIVFLHQDGWMPWGRGKHTQHEPIAVRFELNAKLENNELAGRYTASFGGEFKGKHYNPGGDDSADVTLPDTRYEGAISGRGGSLVIGRYAAQGDFGEQVGALNGMLLDAERPVRDQVKLAESKVSVATVGTVLHEIRALHLALQHDLSYYEAWRQTDVAAPASADIAEYLKLALRQVGALQPPDAELPAAKAETAGDSPSLGALAAPIDEDQVNVLPADASGWLFLPRWNILGSFDQRLGLERDSGLVPDLVVMPGGKYSQPTDRVGVTVEPARTQQWQSVVCDDPRLGAPWERAAFFPRYVGQVWYGAATLRSKRARKVWLSLEANDSAKLWVNDRLVWVDREREWRYRSFGRVFVRVSLAAGENRILARVHSDRQLSWLRLALTTRKPALPRLRAARSAESTPYIFPDAQPPLAWDLAKGINVAWRNADLGGGARPLVVRDAILVTSGTDTLTSVDAATGEIRWARDLKEKAGLPAGAPVSDGKRVWFLSGAGTVACYDLKGELRWSQPVQLPRPRMYLCDDKLIFDAQFSREDKGRGTSATVRVLALDAGSGKEAWRRGLAGRSSGKGLALTIGKATVLLSSTGVLLRTADGEPLDALDCEMQLNDKQGAAVRDVTAGPYRLHAGPGMLYLTSQARHVGLRLWTRGGKIGSAHVWESNYGSSGWGNFPAPGLATDKYLFTWHASLAHTPHCPDPRAEVNVQDVRDGRWIARLKPVMDDLYSYGTLNLSSPVIAGKYLFLLGGRSSNKRNQIAIVTADDRIKLIASHDVESGTTRAPVFAGDRMFLRSAQSLICVAVTTREGRRYQKEALARTMFRVIGPEPRDSKARDVAGMGRLSAAGDVPVGKFMNERPTEFWLGAGPFPVGSLKAPAMLAAVRAKVGTVVAGKAFAPLSRQHAYREPPAYIRTGELQGTGDITPRFKSQVDPRGVSGPAGSGLLYTVLDNVRNRLVAPVLKGKGITQWLGGRKLAPDTPVHLSPGLYPYLVRVDPEFYDVKEKEILVPVNVTNALAKGALRDVGWPKMWQVLGPLPADAATLPGEQLRAVPRKLVVGEQDCKLFPFPVKGYTVDLGCLVKAELGEEPDRAAEFLKPTKSVTAYAFATIECPADGYLYISAGSDWYMCWYVDGVPVYDRLKKGNAARPGDINAHPFAVRVSRGRHVVVIRLRAGGGGWNFTSMGGFSEKPGDQLAEFRVESKLKKGPPDLRLQPCFREIPYPPTLKRMWLDRIARDETRLQAVAKELPGTPEAQRAKTLLEQGRR